MNTQSLTRGLAFFSVGLGMVELLAPRPLARAIGVDEDHDLLLRGLGLREMGAGLGLMQGNPALFMWSRVGGDAIDLGLLAAALRSRKSNRKRVLGAVAAVAGVTALDILAGVLLSRNPSEPEWRVSPPDRSGLQRGEPREMRGYADDAMARHASGHLKAGAGQSSRPAAENHATAPQQTSGAESEAMREFRPGD